MYIPHKNADVIKAFADGKEIQFRSGAEYSWINVDSAHLYATLLSPNGGGEFRIKPDVVKGWYRVALTQGNCTETADEWLSEEKLEKSSDFIRWLTDRVEYEVENEGE